MGNLAMNDPREIAINVIKKWKAHRAPPRDGTAFIAIHAEDWMDLSIEFAAALQAERAAGAEWMALDRGKQLLEIDRLKTELERVEAELTKTTDYMLRATSERDLIKAECATLKAERDEAVKLLEPMVEAAKRYTDYTPNNNLPAWVGLALGHCRAARAVVEKVKQ